ncbi:hypothetical protein AUK40_06330 [Candidatus Wirthbacteria bacterium CG2_30_54_11]|uniref:EamA domain-containing protein n=1 Tax=Candidatus Wirthbacteria bacterium CG2_30_54_11 TaxID=1817892 RepID=A0A1J5IDC3_9BACT|nr:MAG: hypothetical protein AUK40_06330 [Candidatus Wirthbacteria bacterium CG2_30_54_11]
MPVNTQRPTSHPLLWHAQLILAVILWGIYHPLTQVLRGHFSPFILTFARPFFAALSLVAITWASKKKEKVQAKDFLLLAILGVLGMIYPSYATAFGVRMTSSINSSLLINTNPLWIVLLAAIVLKEPITRRKAAGILLALTGVLILFLARNHGSLDSLIRSDYFIGNCILLSGAVSLAAYTILLAPLLKKYSSLTINLYTFSFSALMLLPVGLGLSEFSTIGRISLPSWLGLICLGVFCTGLNFVLFAASLKHFPVSTAASYKLLIPVFSSLFAVIWLGEQFTLWILVALVLSISGIFFIQRKTARSTLPPVEL